MPQPILSKGKKEGGLGLYRDRTLDQSDIILKPILSNPKRRGVWGSARLILTTSKISPLQNKYA